MGHFYDWFMSGWFVPFWPSALAGFEGLPEGTIAGRIFGHAGLDRADDFGSANRLFKAGVVLNADPRGRRVDGAHDGGEATVVVIHFFDLVWFAGCIYDNGEASTPCKPILKVLSESYSQ
jgi:hypothetical protein